MVDKLSFDRIYGLIWTDGTAQSIEKYLEYLDSNEIRYTDDDMSGAVYRAVKRGNTDVVKTLLRHQEKKQEKKSKKRFKNPTQVLDNFFGRSILGDLYDDEDRTPISTAIEKGDHQTLKALLESSLCGKLDIDRSSRYRKDMLSYAIIKGNKDVINVLLKSEKCARLITDFKDEEGVTPLMHAIANRDIDTVKKIINLAREKGVIRKVLNATVSTTVDNSKVKEESVLMWAISRGSRDIVKLIMDQKDKNSKTIVDPRKKYGKTKESAKDMAEKGFSTINSGYVGYISAQTASYSTRNEQPTNYRWGIWKEKTEADPRMLEILEEKVPTEDVTDLEKKIDRYGDIEGVLHNAVKEKDIDLVKKILQMQSQDGSPIVKTNESGATLLMEAVKTRNIELFQLIKRFPGVDIEAKDVYKNLVLDATKDEFGFRALDIAVRNGDVEMISALNIRNDEKISKLAGLFKQHRSNRSIGDINALLRYAVEKEDIDCVKVILALKIIDPITRATELIADINQTNDSGETLLMEAVKKGNKELVNLIRSQHRVNVSAINKKGDTALIMAVNNGNPHIVSELCSRTTAGTKKNDIYCSYSDCTEILKEKIQNDKVNNVVEDEENNNVVKAILALRDSSGRPLFDIDAKIDGTPLLEVAVEKGKLEVAREILRFKDAQRNQPTSITGVENDKTILMIAARQGNLAVVKELLEEKSDGSRLVDVDPKQKDSDGETVLMIAAECKRNAKEMVEVILGAVEKDKKAELINAQSNIGWTAMMYACEQNGGAARAILNEKDTDGFPHANVWAESNARRITAPEICLDRDDDGRLYREIKAALVLKGESTKDMEKNYLKYLVKHNAHRGIVEEANAGLKGKYTEFEPADWKEILPELDSSADTKLIQTKKLIEFFKAKVELDRKIEQLGAGGEINQKSGKMLGELRDLSEKHAGSIGSARGMIFITEVVNARLYPASASGRALDYFIRENNREAITAILEKIDNIESGKSILKHAKRVGNSDTKRLVKDWYRGKFGDKRSAMQKFLEGDIKVGSMGSSLGKKLDSLLNHVSKEIKRRHGRYPQRERLRGMGEEITNKSQKMSVEMSTTNKAKLLKIEHLEWGDPVKLKGSSEQWFYTSRHLEEGKIIVRKNNPDDANPNELKDDANPNELKDDANPNELSYGRSTYKVIDIDQLEDKNPHQGQGMGPGK